MKITLAQIRPAKGDIEANIKIHKCLIQLAIKEQTDAIFFPELSLTGYEPELAKELATDREDDRLVDFQKLSDEYDIAIGLGLPTLSNEGVHISMLVFQSKQERRLYSKQRLHKDELPYFVAGKEQVIFNFGREKIAPAICYESLRESHAANAHYLGANIYLASVAKPQSGLDKAMLHYPKIAKQYGMAVMMVNCLGFCDNFKSVGSSGIWSSEGKLLAQMDSEREGILSFDTETYETMIVYLQD